MNRLGREMSPYLLQHKDNPVHWWAWGPEALAEAKRSGRPILLSVGYAACHWCHVMAHESFEDAATAAVMNELFVNIKVDREERPDIDAIYMASLHRLSEHGGWPLTMFLDADARPFWGGTYFPPTPRYGKPSFRHVLGEVARIYREEPNKVAGNAEAIVGSLAPERHPGARVNINDALLADVSARLVRAVDPINGGLSGAPKFPQWNVLWLLWRGAIRYANADAQRAVALTLDRICQGGIYDHIGGGFARYSVDERWLVPHFEKMLYDNALLVDLMTEVWRETKSPLLAARIDETVRWLEREMIAEGGGLAASLDADSEGEEGKFYVWSRAEVLDALGPEDGEVFCAAYDITDGGNFEGHNIPNRLAEAALAVERDSDRGPTGPSRVNPRDPPIPHPPRGEGSGVGGQSPMTVAPPHSSFSSPHPQPLPIEGRGAQPSRLAAMRAVLLERRAGRIRPGWDDKVLADWNGLMIAALANAGRAFGRPEWLALATRAFDFVVARMQVNGRLIHAFRAGIARAPATASDYANMTWGALRLFAATGESRFLDAAHGWSDVLDRHYWDASGGGYCMTADDTPDVIVRLCSAHDDATPNANAIHLTNLVHLFLLTGESRYMQRAEAIPHAFAADLQRSLIGHAGLLANVLDVHAPQHVVVVGEDPAEPGPLTHVLGSLSLPGALAQVIADPARMPASPALAGKGLVDGRAAVYVCVGPQCSPPVTEAAVLADLLRRTRQVASSAA